MSGDMRRMKFRLHRVGGGIVAIAALLLAATPALSQSSDTLSISDTLAGSEGRVGANAAAGDLNQQVNSAVIAVGDTAILTDVVMQNLEGNSVSDGSDQQNASITGFAFSDSHGAIAVNGAAGSENQQANLAAIGIGIEGPVVSLEVLSQTRSSQQPAGYQDEPDLANAEIGPQAFAESSGLVQVNLTAGERNSSANLFALTIREGADQ